MDFYRRVQALHQAYALIPKIQVYPSTFYLLHVEKKDKEMANKDDTHQVVVIVEAELCYLSLDHQRLSLQGQQLLQLVHGGRVLGRVDGHVAHQAAEVGLELVHHALVPCMTGPFIRRDLGDWFW